MSKPVFGTKNCHILNAKDQHKTLRMRAMVIEVRISLLACMVPTIPAGMHMLQNEQVTLSIDLNLSTFLVKS